MGALTEERELLELAIPSSRIAGVVDRGVDIAAKLTQPVFLDVENVPSRGPFMLVGNHQLLGMQDLPYLVRGLEVLRGVRVRGLADHFHFAVPLWRHWLAGSGAVPGTRENCAALLAAGEPVLVFPGGAREVYKRRNQHYQLLWANRVGFARMAIAAGCPIIPFGAVGAEDRFRVLLDTDHRVAAPVRAVIRHVAGRNDVGTLLVRGSGPAGLPRPDRLYFRFGAPIPTTRWGGRTDDPEALTDASGPELDEGVWSHARAIAESTGASALLALRPTAASGEPPAPEALDGVVVAYLQERMADAEEGGLPGAPPAPDDIASYLHTGGTTGTPKLAVRTHANEVSNAWMTRASNVLDESSVIFGALPLFHTNALVVTVLGPLLKGQHVVWGGPLGYRDLPLFENFRKIVQRYRIAAMSAVPTVYSVLTQIPVDADISSLKLPIVGAAPLPPAVRVAFEARTGVPLCEGYGLTEGTCVSAVSWPGAPRSGTVGQRLPYQEARTVKIDEATGNWTFLPENEIGTLVLRGPNIFAGYLVHTGSRREVLTDGKVKDRWLDTGDLTSVDGDGFIRLAGRAKDLIIRGGHNIDPATIEDALLAHPNVTAAAAVGRPDPHAGEVPVAFVTIATGADCTSDELEAWAAAHVPERAAAPKHVEIVEEISLTSVGKPYKPELRRRAAEQATRDALAETGLGDRIRAVLVHAAPEIHVPHSPHDDEVSEALSQYAWTWKLTN